jgi:hypothetical protein
MLIIIEHQSGRSLYTKVDFYCFSTITGNFNQPKTLKDTRVPSPKFVERFPTPGRSLQQFARIFCAYWFPVTLVTMLQEGPFSPGSSQIDSNTLRHGRIMFSPGDCNKLRHPTTQVLWQYAIYSEIYINMDMIWGGIAATVRTQPVVVRGNLRCCVPQFVAISWTKRSFQKHCHECNGEPIRARNPCKLLEWPARCREPFNKFWRRHTCVF